MSTTGPPESDIDIDLKSLFRNGIDLQTADNTLIQQYVRYRFQQYASQNIVDYRLWDAMSVDFEKFTKDHLDSRLDGPTWNVVKDYCYPNGFWIDHNYGAGRSRGALMLKSIKAEWNDK